MSKVMLTIHGRSPDLTLDELVREFKLSETEIDREYGLQLIDPAAGDYVILVEESAARRIDPDQVAVSGPYADVEIETFGLEKSRDQN